MKKLYFLLLTMVILLGCNVNGNNKEDKQNTYPEYEYIPMDWSVIRPECMTIEYPHQPNNGLIWGEEEFYCYFHIPSTHSVDKDYLEWEQSIKPILDHIGSQYEQAQVAADNRLQTIYLYAAIDKFEITANESIFGHDKGENLADFFYLLIGDPIFTYPDGDMTNIGGEITNYEIANYIENRYMSINKWVIKPKESICHEELPEQIEFTLSVTLSTGDSAECKFSPRTK